MVDSEPAHHQSNPFGQFRKECEHVLQASYFKLRKVEKRSLSEIEIAPTLEDPPNQEFGQLASSLSFELARAQKTKPMLIAREIADEAKKSGPFKLIDAIEAAEPGYVNFKAKASSLAQLTLEAIHQEGKRYGMLWTSNPHRLIVEHTSANPARPIHIGTAKNAIFGDTLARILAARGHRVQTHFYIDDTGRQVAQMAYGYKLLGEPEPQGKTDEFFGRIYSITSTLAEVDENKKRLALLRKTNASDLDIVAVTKAMDEWVGVSAELNSKYPKEFDLLSERMSKDLDPQKSILDLVGKYEKAEPLTRALIRRVSQMVLAGFEQTLRRSRIHFDQWDWESELLWTGRVKELLDRLKETGYAQTKAGAWVFDVGKAVSDYELREKLGLSPSFDVTSLTLTRSDGTSLYPTRDIAYTMF